MKKQKLTLIILLIICFTIIGCNKTIQTNIENKNNEPAISNETEIQKTDETKIQKINETEIQKIDETEIPKTDETEIQKINETEIQKINETEIQKIDETEIQKIDEVKYLEYENKKYNFKIQIPNTWTFQEETNGFNVEIKTPKNDEINENLGIVVQELQTNETLETYTKNTIKGLKDLYENYIEISKEYTEINSTKGAILTYELSENGYEIKAQQTVFLKGNKAYVFQYTATKNTFNRYINEINHIINSFAILN